MGAYLSLRRIQILVPHRYPHPCFSSLPEVTQRGGVSVKIRCYESTDMGYKGKREFDREILGGRVSNTGVTQLRMRTRRHLHAQGYELGVWWYIETRTWGAPGLLGSLRAISHEDTACLRRACSVFVRTFRANCPLSPGHGCKRGLKRRNIYKCSFRSPKNVS